MLLLRIPPRPPQPRPQSLAVMWRSCSTRPSQPVAAGSTFQVPIVLLGATDVASVPIQVQYDPASLSLVNVNPGDLLSRDGQAVALVHRDDGPGNITINVPPVRPVGRCQRRRRCVRSQLPGPCCRPDSLSMTRAAAVTTAQASYRARETP
jgi:general secretion pathway protein D